MADDQIVTNIVAKADLSSLVTEVHRATASLQKLQQDLSSAGKTVASQIKVINNSFGETLRSTGQFASHFVTLHSDVEKFGKGLDSGRLKLRDYFQAFNQHAKQQGGLIRDLAKQQVMLQNAVMQPLGKNAQGLMQYSVHIPAGLDLVKNKANLARMELQIMNRAINEGATALINWGKNTQWAGRQLTVGLTVPIAGFGAAAAKAFREADQELTRLSKVYGDIGGATADELTKVRRDIIATSKELSSALGVNYKETISLAADIAATGKQGNELMGSLRETTRLAVLGEVDRAEAMKATLAIQTAFKQNTDELADSINFLNAVENQTSTTLNDLVEAIPKAGPVIKGLGGSVQDLALYLTAMREGGISASEGANALKSGLASLINPTNVAVAKFSDFGIDLLGMVQRNAGNTTAMILEMQSALDKLDPLQKQQAIEQLFGKFQFSRLNALFNNLGRQGSQTLQVMDLMKASAGDLEAIAGRELTAVTESASGQYKRAIEGLKAELSTLGEDFLTLGTKFVNIITKLLKFLNDLPEPVKKLITAFGGLTAVAGPVIMLTGVLANFAGYLLKGSTNLKALLSGSKGWKMLTPEIVAANHAAQSLEQTFYSDAQAAAVLEQALRNLIDEFNVLNNTVNSGNISVRPAVTTMANNLIMPGSAAMEVDPANRLVGDMDTRAFSHINPRKSGLAGQLFGVVPGAIPVNRKIGANPQIYMTERLPDIEGLTSVGGVSTGIVAQEAAKFHALMGTLGMQTDAEVAQLKKVIALGGTLSSELLNTYDDLLPITSKFADKAAAESAAIVSELRAAKITVDQARLKIMQLNAQIEAEMTAEVAQYAASQGRTIDVTKAPLMNQPLTDQTGKYTLRDLFKRENNKNIMEEFGRLRGVKTFGAPYSMEVNRLKRFNSGGSVFYNNGDQVPGPNINADVVPAMLTPGEFVIRRGIAQQDPDGMRALNEGRAVVVPLFNRGGRIPRVQYANNGSKITSMTGLAKGMESRLLNKDYDEDLRIRTVMHDAAIINRMGFDVDEAIDIAEKNYRDAIRYSLDRSMPGGTDINPDLWAEIRTEQLRRFDNLAYSRFGKRAIIEPGNNITGQRQTQGVRPTRDLINAMRLRGGQFSQTTLDAVVSDVSRFLNNRRFAYESEHTLPYSSWQKQGALGVGNLFQAVAGSREFNQASSSLNILTRGGIQNITPLSSRAAKLQWNTIVGMIRGMKPILSNRGGMIPGYNIGGMIPGYNGGGGISRAGLLARLGAKFKYEGKTYDGPQSLQTYRINAMDINGGKKYFGHIEGLSDKGRGALYNATLEFFNTSMIKGHMVNGKRLFTPTSMLTPFPTIASYAITSGKGFLSESDIKILEGLSGRGGSLAGSVGSSRQGMAKIYGRLFTANRGGMVPGYSKGGGVVRPGRLLYGENPAPYLSPAWMATRYAAENPSVRSRGPGMFSAFKEGFSTQRSLIGTGKSDVDPYIKMNAIAMGGSMLGMGAMSAGQSGLGMGIMAAANFLPLLTPKLMSIKNAMSAATFGVGGLTKAFRLLGMATKFAWPIAAISATALVIKKLVDNVKEYQREQTLLTGMTEEGAKQAGIKYNNLSASIKNVTEQIKAQRALGRATYDAMAPAGLPGMSITIKEMREAKKFARENLTEFVNTFNTISSDQVVPLAQNIKAQFIAGGMSAEEATKKIYGIVAASEKAKDVLKVLGSSGFAIISDKASAADFMVKNLVKNLEGYTRSNDLGNSFSNTLSVIDGIRKGLEGTKDATGQTITQSEALKQTLQQVKDINGSDRQIGQIKLDQLKQSQPELAAILNSADTIASAYAKWQVAISGARVNLKNMTADQALMLAEFDTAMSTAMTNLAEQGGSNSTFGKIGKQISGLNKIAMSVSIAAQRNAEKTRKQIEAEIKLIDEKIRKINEEADAKIKALQRVEQKENYQLDLQKAQLDYQDALARGDMAAAARAQLNIDQLVKERQNTLAIDAIQDERERKIKKAEAEKEARQKALERKETAFQNNQMSAQDAAAARDELIKQQAEYQRLVKNLANAQAMPNETLKETTARNKAIKEATGELANFQSTIRNLMSSGTASQKKAFTEAFGDMMQQPAGVFQNMGSVVGGKYIPGGTVSTIGQDVQKDIDRVNREALAITGGKKLSDLYKLINEKGLDGKGGGSQYGKNNPFMLRGTYDTKKDGTLTDEARGQIVDKLDLNKDDFFSYNGQLYRVTGSKMTNARAYLVKKAAGGMITGPGSGTSDSIPAMLSNGEYVINAAAVKNIGVPMLDRINGMAKGGLATRFDIPKYATGGRIMYGEGGEARSSNALYNINVTLNGTNMNPDDVAKAISREMKLREAASGIGRRY